MDEATLKRVMEQDIPYNRHLGVELTATRAGFVRLEIPFRDVLIGDPLRPALHGGVISALADAAGGAAVMMGAQASAGVSTIDLRIDYLRPGRLERLVAEATMVRLGNRVGVVDIRCFHPSAEAETIATGKGVYNIVGKRRPA